MNQIKAEREVLSNKLATLDSKLLSLENHLNSKNQNPPQFISEGLNATTGTHNVDPKDKNPQNAAETRESLTTPPAKASQTLIPKTISRAPLPLFASDKKPNGPPSKTILLIKTYPIDVL